MSDTAHTFQFNDGSLRSRMNEFLVALEAYNSVLMSKKFSDDPEWSDRLGDEKDIEEAEHILHRSLIRSISSVEAHELKLAIEEGLLTEEQAKEFSQKKLTHEFEEGQKPRSSTHGHKN